MWIVDVYHAQVTRVAVPVQNEDSSDSDSDDDIGPLKMLQAKKVEEETPEEVAPPAPGK